MKETLAFPNSKIQKKYIKEKVRILVRDFGINPDATELNHLNTLTDEHDIDRAIRTIINNHWDA